MNDYVMSGGQEIERLVIQARAWEPSAEAVLAKLGIQANWSCLDLGCGPIGILPCLARCVDATGRIVGVERDPNCVAAAREIMRLAGRSDVDLIEADVLASGLARDSFDLVHARFLLPHVSEAAAALSEMISLAKPGGLVLVQEPDHSSWQFYPPLRAWSRLVEVGEQAFARAGVEINIGRRTFSMLREAGLEEVRINAATLALQDRHPYMRMGLTAAETLKPIIVGAGLATAQELAQLVNEVEHHLEQPDTWQLTFTTTQVWGRRPRSA